MTNNTTQNTNTNPIAKIINLITRRQQNVSENVTQHAEEEHGNKKLDDEKHNNTEKCITRNQNEIENRENGGSKIETDQPTDTLPNTIQSITKALNANSSSTFTSEKQKNTQSKTNDKAQFLISTKVFAEVAITLLNENKCDDNCVCKKTIPLSPNYKTYTLSHKNIQKILSIFESNNKNITKETVRLNNKNNENNANIAECVCNTKEPAATNIPNNMTNQSSSGSTNNNNQKSLGTNIKCFTNGLVNFFVENIVNNKREPSSEIPLTISK